MLNCAPAGLSDYVRGLNSTVLEVVTEINDKRSPTAKNCPCVECDGKGYFIEYCTYAKASAPSDLLQSKKGALTARRLVTCYVCLGYGIDAQKFSEAIREHSDYEKALEAGAVINRSREVFCAEERTQVGHRFKNEQVPDVRL